MTGFLTLAYKEMLRFWKVAFQTIAAPVLTAFLYLLIFSHLSDGEVAGFGVSFRVFLIPGLVIMSVLQNSFANASSSLIQSRMSGSLVFMLLPPISYLQFFAAYVLAAVVRGAVVGLGVLAATACLAVPPLREPLWALAFLLLAAALFGVLGLLAGIWAETYDQLAAAQNFLVLPLTMLSGVFYSIHTLSPLWQQVSHFNPVFYMIDGFRYGFFAVADVSPLRSLSVLLVCLVVMSALVLKLLQRGWKLRG
jgi:ABC-2 type transport system permease protein